MMVFFRITSKDDKALNILQKHEKEQTIALNCYLYVYI